MYGHQHSIFPQRQCQTCMLTFIVCSIRKARGPYLLNVHLKRWFTYFFHILQIKPTIRKKKKKKKMYKIKLYLNYPVTNKTSATANARYANTHLGKPWF